MITSAQEAKICAGGSASGDVHLSCQGIRVIRDDQARPNATTIEGGPQCAMFGRVRGYCSYDLNIAMALDPHAVE
jgi:hypothetical protein